MPRHPLFALLLAALIAGCTSKSDGDDDAYDHVMSFDTARIRLARQQDTLHLLVELARSAEQKSMGLMERKTLARDAGMLFVYDSIQPGSAGFWMYRTRIPLDIAFLDTLGVIRAVRAMVPCPTTIAEGCQSYTPDTPYQYALEVNAGFFARERVDVGQRLMLQDLPPAPPTSSR